MAGTGRRPWIPTPNACGDFLESESDVGGGFLKEGPVPHLRSATNLEALNQAANPVELRERTLLAERMKQKAVLAPLPLYDFTNNGSSSQDFDEVSEYYARTGVGGKRLLRAKDQTPPQAGCETNEEFWKESEPREPVAPRYNVQGEEVYVSTFQDLSSHTPECVITQLEAQTDPQTAMRPFYTPADENDKTLVFESRFESGNLYSATKIGPFEYDLVLQNDTNTSGHTQWYFFSVTNTRALVPYRFNITNFLKPESLYNQGLRPLLLSTKSKDASKLAWRRGGSDIRYYNNAARRRAGAYAQAEAFWTLSFTITFDHSFDTCYLAHCYPYTFRDLQVYLHQISQNPDQRKYVKRKRLCETEAGNDCDVLTITREYKAGREGENESEPRKGVVITSRVHPGETQTSYMVQGLIDFLSSEDPQAAQLREHFVFKVVPMLNPDGVINGNYRCSLSGHDLNRRWHRPHEKQHATIAATKAMIEQFMKEYQVVLFLDLHGHSNKKGVFTYGNDQREIEERFPAMTMPHGGPQQRLAERIFPYLLTETVPGFAYSKCSFKVQRAKLATGRVVNTREFGLTNSYTLEASFSGAADSKYHFDIPTFQQMGKGICLGILACFAGDPSVRNTVLERLYGIESGVYSDEENNSEDSSSGDESKGDAGVVEGMKRLQSVDRGLDKRGRSPEQGDRSGAAAQRAAALAPQRSISPEQREESATPARTGTPIRAGTPARTGTPVQSATPVSGVRKKLNPSQEREDKVIKGRRPLAQDRDELDSMAKARSLEVDEGAQCLREVFARMSSDSGWQRSVDTKASRVAVVRKVALGKKSEKPKELHCSSKQASIEDSDEEVKELQVIDLRDGADAVHSVGATPCPCPSPPQVTGHDCHVKPEGLKWAKGSEAAASSAAAPDSEGHAAIAEREAGDQGGGNVIIQLGEPLHRHPSGGVSGSSAAASGPEQVPGKLNVHNSFAGSSTVVPNGGGKKVEKKNVAGSECNLDTDCLRPPTTNKGRRFPVKSGALTARSMLTDKMGGATEGFAFVLASEGFGRSVSSPCSPRQRTPRQRKTLKSKRKGFRKRCKSVDDGTSETTAARALVLEGETGRSAQVEDLNAIGAVLTGQHIKEPPSLSARAPSLAWSCRTVPHDSNSVARSPAKVPPGGLELLGPVAKMRTDKLSKTEMLERPRTADKRLLVLGLGSSGSKSSSAQSKFLLSPPVIAGAWKDLENACV